MENSTLTQDDGQTEVCGALNFEFKVVLVHPSKVQFANYVMVFVTNIFVSLITIFLNVTTILTFRSSNHLQKKLCHFLIYVQSWSDLGIGLIVSPLYSIIIGSKLLGNGNCRIHQIWFCISVTSSVFSVIILSAMNLERYMCIIHPFYHRNKVTKKKLLVYIRFMCAFFTSTFAVFIPLGANVFTIFFFICFLHFITSVYIYTKIFLVGKAHFKRNRLRANGLRRNTKITIKCATKPVQADQNRGHQQGIFHNPGPSSVSDEIVSICQDRSLNTRPRQPDNANDLSHIHSRQLGDKVRTAHSETESSGSEKRNSNPERKVHDNEQVSKRLTYRKSEREIIMKFKLAKSWAIVVSCFFISFLVPLISQGLPLSRSDFVILDAWINVIVPLNATLDYLTFFWKSKMLRNEAKKVLKNICC